MGRITDTYFIAMATEHYNDRGGDGGRTDTIVGVTETYPAAVKLLRTLGVTVGRILEVFPPRQRTDGTWAPCAPDIFPYDVTGKRKA